MQFWSWCCTGPCFWQAWHPLAYFMKSANKERWLASNGHTFFLAFYALLDVIHILYSIMDLKQDFFGFLLTRTPEEQSVLSTPIQYSVNQSIIQSLLFASLILFPGSFFRRIGQVPDERLLSIILPDLFWLHYVTFSGMLLESSFERLFSCPIRKSQTSKPAGPLC